MLRQTSLLTWLRSYKQAMATPDASLWKAAAETEMEHHRRNGSWRYVIPPAGAKVLPGMWVLTVKHNLDGSVLRHKARYVVKGFSQRPGFDYTEIYAPTFRQASLRLVAAMAAQHDLHMHSVDRAVVQSPGAASSSLWSRFRLQKLSMLLL